MDKKNEKVIFLSASIPDERKEKDIKYFNTADKTAIRDAVRALASVVIPHAHLVWGGHPSITPLIRHVLQTVGYSAAHRVTLYQSDFFKFQPKENEDIENIVRTKDLGEREPSVELMRKRMLTEHHFSVGIFIGGMDGVEDEYNLFRKCNPKALAIPIASTGAAAKFIYERTEVNRDERLLNDYAYVALFKSLLKNKIKLK